MPKKCPKDLKCICSETLLDLCVENLEDSHLDCSLISKVKELPFDVRKHLLSLCSMRKAFGDHVVDLFLDTIKELGRLDVPSNPLSSTALKTILLHCPDLYFIDISRCPNIGGGCFHLLKGMW